MNTKILLVTVGLLALASAMPKKPQQMEGDGPIIIIIRNGEEGSDNIDIDSDSFEGLIQVPANPIENDGKKPCKHGKTEAVSKDNGGSQSVEELDIIANILPHESDEAAGPSGPETNSQESEDSESDSNEDTFQGFFPHFPMFSGNFLFNQDGQPQVLPSQRPGRPNNFHTMPYFGPKHHPGHQGSSLNLNL